MAQDRHQAAEEVIVALATTPGRSALGVVRVAGAKAREICEAFIFQNAPLEPRRATLAQARAGGEKIDDVVAVYYPPESSPLGEALVEITAHGSPLVLAKLVDAALASGARHAEPGEFTRRAFINGKLDLAQAEGVADLIDARTEGARRAALRRLDGELSRAVKSLRLPLFDLLVRVEASLDHPEDEIPLVSADEAADGLAAGAAGLRALAAGFARGRAARQGARVCLAGRPNAGKSSLLNALLGFERAIVSALPGTTRDTVEESLELDGAPLVLVDTAGAREGAQDPAELEGVARGRRALEGADLAVLVVDGSRPLDAEDRAAHRALLDARAGRPLLWVLNKSDLERRVELDGIAVSARERTGLERLVFEIGARLGEDAASSSGEDGLVDRRHRALLEDAARELEAGRARVLSGPGDWEDCAAFNLRQACARLGEILGEGSPDEALAGVFSRFCVGK